MSSVYTMQVGDVVVLACDRLYELVSDAEIREIITIEPIGEAVNHLVGLANQRGGPDNITVIGVCVEALDTHAPPNAATSGA